MLVVEALNCRQGKPSGVCCVEMMAGTWVRHGICGSEGAVRAGRDHDSHEASLAAGHFL